MDVTDRGLVVRPTPPFIPLDLYQVLHRLVSHPHDSLKGRTPRFLPGFEGMGSVRCGRV